MYIKTVCSIVMSLLFASGSCSAFSLSQTRIILSQDQGSTSLTVNSGENDPLYLIRSQIIKNMNDSVNVSEFMVTPPLARLEKGGKSELRISPGNIQKLPTDRESQFYLKVVGIPPTNPLLEGSTTGFAQGSMLVGTGNIIKLFYRPHGIGAPDAQAYKKLVWSRVPGGLQVSNPTPWNITFNAIRVDGQSVSFTQKQPQILPPFGKQFYGTTSAQKKQISWSVINDDGENISGNSTAL